MRYSRIPSQKNRALNAIANANANTTANTPNRSKKWILPTAVALGVTLAVPAISDAQSSFGSFSAPDTGVSDYLDNPSTQRSPVRTERMEIQGLPEGVSIDRVEWLTNRRVAVFINSAAMPDAPVQVQLLLPRDWYSQPNRTFPSLWALDGLRAREDENGWTINTNIEQQFADKNVLVVLPVGGESSFYADWLEPDNGKHYKWETFLMQELVPVLANGFRDNGERAVVGLSMGGTAAMNLAERNPAEFNFVGSFSGYLDTTSAGMPAAIRAAQWDAGNYTTERMWGPDGSQQWIDNDPKLGIAALKDMTVYVSAGSGADDYGQPTSVATEPANYAGVGLEIISRRTSETFVQYAKQAGVEVFTQFRPSGVHNWAYWQFELNNASPLIQKALGLGAEDWGASCAVGTAISDAAAAANLGACVSDEYDVAGGKVADFANGRAYFHQDTGAVGLHGRIGALYASFGGPDSWLGFPLHGERSIKGGAYARFQHGNIYWTPETGAVAVPTALLDKWGTQQWENGPLGYPQAEAVAIGEGLIQQFRTGYIAQAPGGETFIVHGEIAKKYGEMSVANSKLGYPTSDEMPLRGGAFQRFEHGNIYWSPQTGAHVIYYGPIFDKWGESGWENGPFGYPTEDQAQVAGGEVVQFRGGSITQIGGQVREVRN